MNQLNQRLLQLCGNLISLISRYVPMAGKATGSFSHFAHLLAK